MRKINDSRPADECVQVQLIEQYNKTMAAFARCWLAVNNGEHRMKLLLLTLATLVAFTGSVRAETAVPDHLVIGYDNEGEIDANPQTCVAHVKDMGRTGQGRDQEGR